MYKLLAKTALFTVGLLLLLNLLGAFSQAAAPIGETFYYAEQDYRLLMERRDQVQAISIGNSHSAALNFEALGVEGQVLTRAGADLFEVERYIKHVVPRLPALETVFISLSYYSFSRDNATLDNMQTLRVQLYTMLPIWRPVAGDESNWVLGKLDKVARLLSVTRSDHWRGIILPESGFASLLNNVASYDPAPADVNEVCPYLEVTKMEKHAQDIAAKNVDSSRMMATLHPGLQEDALDILAETIAYLQEQGIEVVLYTPPYHAAYTARFMEQGSDLAQEMHAAVAQLQTDYDIAYYDFSAEPDLISNVELFYNSDHVNECGGRAFSARLGQNMRAAR